MNNYSISCHDSILCLSTLSDCVLFSLQLSGEDGIGIADLLTQATMDQRINSYRLIMASTRAILDSDGSSGSPCVDPDLDDVFEELGLQNDQEEEGNVQEPENLSYVFISRAMSCKHRKYS